MRVVGTSGYVPSTSHGLTIRQSLVEALAKVKEESDKDNNSDRNIDEVNQRKNCRRQNNKTTKRSTDDNILDDGDNDNDCNENENESGGVKHNEETKIDFSLNQISRIMQTFDKATDETMRKGMLKNTGPVTVTVGRVDHYNRIGTNWRFVIDRTSLDEKETVTTTTTTADTNNSKAVGQYKKTYDSKNKSAHRLRLTEQDTTSEGKNSKKRKFQILAYNDV